MILPGKGSGIFQLYRRFLTFFVQVPQRDFCLACEAVWHSKPFYISHAVSYFCETELEIWASFGPADSTENFCNFSKVCDLHLRMFSPYFNDLNKYKIRVYVQCTLYCPH